MSAFRPQKLGRDLVDAMRRATLLMLVDRLGQISKKSNHCVRETTWEKVLKAADGCGLTQSDDGRDVRELARSRDRDWQALIGLLEHQLSYLELASSMALNEPRDQIFADPKAYAGFLAGVAASHLEHARFVASLPELASLKTLVDLGAGFGAYSLAWVTSQENRSATLMDLPGVRSMLPPAVSEHDRMAFSDLDLTASPLQLSVGDVYLVANVLSLFWNWQAIFKNIVRALPPKAILAIKEASPEGKEGALFDLQVHIRSGYRGGLIRHADLLRAARQAGLILESNHEMHDAEDIFGRVYNVTVFSRSKVQI